MKQKIIFFILAVILLACGNRDEIVETEENTIVTTGESTNEVTAANATECVFIPYPDLGSNGDTRFRILGNSLRCQLHFNGICSQEE